MRQCSLPHAIKDKQRNCLNTQRCGSLLCLSEWYSHVGGSSKKDAQTRSRTHERACRRRASLAPQTSEILQATAGAHPDGAAYGCVWQFIDAVWLTFNQVLLSSISFDLTVLWLLRDWWSILESGSIPAKCIRIQISAQGFQSPRIASNRKSHG